MSPGNAKSLIIAGNSREKSPVLDTNNTRGLKRQHPVFNSKSVPLESLPVPRLLLQVVFFPPQFLQEHAGTVSGLELPNSF